MTRKYILLSTVFILIASILSALFFLIFSNSEKSRSMNNTAEISLTLFSTPRDIHPFQLITHQNLSFSDKNLQGHWTFLFFGFTHCPHICPTTLSKMKQVYASLHTQYPSLQVVLVTVDPKRDTPETLDTYLSQFNPQFIGVTGNPKILNALEKQLGIFAARTPIDDQGNYSM